MALPTTLSRVVLSYFNRAELFVYRQFVHKDAPEYDDLQAMGIAISPYHAAECAASCDWADGLEYILQENKNINRDEVLAVAAGAGSLRSIDILLQSGAKHVQHAVLVAARYGTLASVQKLSHIATPGRMDRVLHVAAQHGQLHVMEYARASDGYASINGALYWAAFGGSLSAMELAKSWGANDFDSALGSAARTDNLEAMRLLKKWGASAYDQALCCAAREGKILAMHLTKEWGATNFTEALGLAEETASLLLLEWGA